MCQWNVCVKENRHKILNIPEADRRSDAPSPSRSGLGLALKALILTSDLVLISDFVLCDGYSVRGGGSFDIERSSVWLPPLKRN